MNTTLALVLLALATFIIGVIALGGDWANRNIDEANKAKPIKLSTKGKRTRKGGRK